MVTGASLLSLAMGLFAEMPAFGQKQKCPDNDAGLSLPHGFCASIFADKIGHARRLAGDA
jgi:hypothetical protein